MTDRSGVEIDYCPQCRGVWLDRGELDKIIERAQTPYSHNRPEHHDERNYRHDDDDDYREHRNHEHDSRSHDSHHKKHKKESFLGDLFDF